MVKCLGFRIQGLGFEVCYLGFRVWDGLGFWVVGFVGSGCPRITVELRIRYSSSRCYIL